MEKIEKSPMGWENDQLTSWTKEYDLTTAPDCVGYVDFADAKTQAKIYFYHDSGGINKIVIKTKYYGRAIATKALLWHEFCHHWDCVVNNCHDHCLSNFRKYQIKKPLLFLIDIFLP